MELDASDFMKKSNLSLLRLVRPLAWVGAVLFFALTEGLLISAQLHHHLYGANAFHFWYVPICCTLPLITGYGFERTIHRRDETRDYPESEIETSSMMAMFVLAGYTVSVCIVSILL
jgi:hypothetical protein